MDLSSAPPVFCALDTTDPQDAAALAGRLRGHVGGLKLGLEFFVANGPDGVRHVMQAGLPLFLDLKFHDIPNTVAGAMKAAAALAPAFTTIHGGGGAEMIRAASDGAAEGAAKAGTPPMKVLAVTVLTSFDQSGLNATGVPGEVADQVKRLGELARRNGADGAVCSAHEAPLLRQACGPDFVLVVPGIRPAWAAAGDQKRITTPAKALAAGADWLVIGRPITGAANPAQAAAQIARDITEGC